MTLLGIFHDHEVVACLTDRVVFMEHGRVRQVGRAGEIQLPRFEAVEEQRPRI